MVKPKKSRKEDDDTKAAAEQMLNIMFAQGRRQWGNAVKSFWSYEGDQCPGCMTRRSER
jgi:hypothetical protein